MNCSYCDKDFPESIIQESHDVPCYLFPGITRNERKNQADKFKRRLLCIKCHQGYEESLRIFLVKLSSEYGINYFNKNEVLINDSL